VVADIVTPGPAPTLEDLIETVPDAMIGVRPDGRIALANSSAEGLFGYERGELIGASVDDLVPDEIRARHAGHRDRFAARPSTRPMGIGLELEGRHKSGRQFPVEISLSSIATEYGPLVAAAIRDLTDRRRTEQTLRAKNLELEKASSAKDRFLASMSHELRTPLNAILGFSGTLLMGLPGPLNEEQESQLRIVRESARHLLAVINDLLDLAKIESGTVEIALEAVDCRSLLEEVAVALRPLAQAKGLAFDVEVPDHPVAALAARTTLGLVLRQLADNAVSLTDEGGVRLVLAERTDGDRRIVTIDVVDTGPGIGDADQDRLFDAFQPQGGTPVGDGTGLGLHISRRRVELLGGTLRCHSAPARGSTFTVELGAG
jgi:PAS domain S-box-containing protein